MLDRRQLRDFDAATFGATMLLVAVGVAMIFSATHEVGATGVDPVVVRQLIVAGLGLLLMLGALFIGQDTLEGLTPVLYTVAMALLVVVLMIGVGKSGERRWFDVGLIRFQPSEVAKYAVILALARYLARRKTRLERPVHLIVPIGIVFLPTMLVLREPDLGTSLIFVLLLLPMLYWAGARPLLLLLLVAPALSMVLAFNTIAWAVFLGLLVWLLYLSRILVIDKLMVFITCVVMGRAGPLLWSHLEDYQRHRVVAFLNPEKYRFSTGYQLIQSKIAIGSGSALGKGFLQGTQKNYAFLPEQHTDFIFSVLAEEFGFIGCLVVLSLYLFLIVRMLRLASQVRNRFAGLVIVGIAGTLFIQTAINIGVTLGLSPVTGMTLPLLSYGGSSLLVTLAAIGIVLGMGIRRMEY
ncbi:MAG: rod shape-determining protein RodA [Candidatus Eisenbacteria bacterium]|nr:rod shape-determining protein RodA [Candidatus Eisenbacteria bacterium]